MALQTVEGFEVCYFFRRGALVERQTGVGECTDHSCVLHYLVVELCYVWIGVDAFFALNLV